MSEFRQFDVIGVPPGGVPVASGHRSGFRRGSVLTVRRARDDQEFPCKGCGRQVRAGDLHAVPKEPTSHRCMTCVEGWPLVERRA